MRLPKRTTFESVAVGGGRRVNLPTVTLYQVRYDRGGRLYLARSTWSVGKLWSQITGPKPRRRTSETTIQMLHYRETATEAIEAFRQALETRLASTPELGRDRFFMRRLDQVRVVRVEDLRICDDVAPTGFHS